MKRVLPLLLSLLLLAGILSVPAMAAIDLDSPAYVVDDANVLSAELEEKIIEINQTLEYDCQGSQLVVVTVTYPTAGMDREEFAKEIFDTWNIGSAEYDNGSLLVVYTESNEFWLECGYGIYNSEYVDEIADMVADDGTFYRALQKGKFEDAVSSLVENLSGWYTHYYGSSNGGGVQFQPGNNGGNGYKNMENQSGSVIQIIFGLILIYIILRIVFSPIIYYRRYKRWGIWPLVYFSSWWKTRPRRTVTPINLNTTSKPNYHSTTHITPPSTFGNFHSYTGSSHSSSSHSSSHSSHSSGFGSFGGGGHSSSGFHGGGGHSSGGGFHGGGGHSGGGFGHR